MRPEFLSMLLLFSNFNNFCSAQPPMEKTSVINSYWRLVVDPNNITVDKFSIYVGTNKKDMILINNWARDDNINIFYIPTKFNSNKKIIIKTDPNYCGEGIVLLYNKCNCN